MGIPTYYDLIPKKNARDLGTIKSKLDGDKYDTTDAWEGDLSLMIQNALIFNGEESEVGQLALQLESRFRSLLAGLQGGPAPVQNKKRAAPGDASKFTGSGSSTVKKVKLS